jgi:integrase/recombinase XerD
MKTNYGKPNATKRTLPNVLNKKQLIALFENIDDGSVFMGCLMALFCGLRISEVCNLKKQDIDLESEKVYVRQGKGAKVGYYVLDLNYATSTGVKYIRHN